jgi:hypothetical protein
MDYEHVSDVELRHLLNEKLPELCVPRVDGFNRHTVIAFLKICGLMSASEAPMRNQASGKEPSSP